MLYSKKHNAISVLEKLISCLKIRVSSTTITNELMEHPDFPSLLAVSDCLSAWKIPHEIYKVDIEENKLKDLSFPFIAHFDKHGEQFVLISSIYNDKVRCSNEKGTYSISSSEFLDKWDGILLYAEKDLQSGEPNYKRALFKSWLQKAGIPFLLLILLGGIFNSIDYISINWTYTTLLGIKFAGIFVSILLLIHSVNANNPLIQNLCSLGKRNNCNAILKSSAAKISSSLSWSEIGMFYFTGTFICLLLAPDSISILSWLSIGCLPYTIYSIGYQLKVKNLCVLCCTVQLLLWMEASIFIYRGNFQLELIHFDFGTIILCFLFPIATWIFIKPFIVKAEQVEPLKLQLKKFKYNSEVFNQLLTAQSHYSVSDDLMPVTLGNPNAQTTITMVSNPYCEPCASTHKTLEDWLSFRDDIQLKIIFATANHDEEDRTKVAKHVIALSLLSDKNIVKDALNKWYSQNIKKYEHWAEEYPVDVDDNMDVLMKRQKDWCEKTEVNFTPTILINGYKLVDLYNLDDIKYLLG